MKSEASNRYIKAYLRAGIAVFPLRRSSKVPAIKDWRKRATSNSAEVNTLFRGHSKADFGAVTGSRSGIFALDIDGKAGRRSLQLLTSAHGNLPKAVTVQTARGQHRYFRMPKGLLRNSAGRIAEGLDIRGEGGFVVAAGSQHPSGVPYKFKNGRSFDEILVAKAPSWLLRMANAETQINPRSVREAPLRLSRRHRRYIETVVNRECERAANATAGHRNDGLNRSAFIIGQFLGFGVLNREDCVRQLNVAGRAAGLSDEETAKTVESGLRAGERNPVTELFPARKPMEVGAQPIERDLIETLSSLGDTDFDLAKRYCQTHVGRVAYSHARGGWMAYDGARWDKDREEIHRKLAMATVEAISAECEFIKDEDRRRIRALFANRAKSRAQLHNMLDLAKSLMAIPDDRFDFNENLLNLRNGTFDLQREILLQHDWRDFQTRWIPTDFDEEAKAPLFLKFLGRIFGGDKTLISYIQRAVGYSLTGKTDEQVFFMCFGTGKNGKSTFLELLHSLLGEYGAHCPIETFTVKHFDNSIPNDLARLKGVRFVSAVEANPGRHLDEARIKQITGGDMITARFMRSEFFEFRPAFKLWLAVNDYPQVRGTASAFWRRACVLPFDQVIEESERDPNLLTKLQAELPGVLAWAIRGTKKWMEHRLGSAKATRHWKSTADHVANFYNREIIIDDASKVSASAMYSHYAQWCKKTSETTLNMRKFKARLIDRNVSHVRVRSGSVWRGVRLRSE